MSVEYKYWDKEKLVKYDEVHKDENGNWHRIDGPALILYREDGSIKCAGYWINNLYLTKEEWETHPLVIAALIDKKLGE